MSTKIFICLLIFALGLAFAILTSPSYIPFVISGGMIFCTIIAIKPSIGIVFFPFFFFFTELSIPGIGSPEKLLTIAILIPFLCGLVLKRPRVYFPRGMLIAFVLFSCLALASISNAENPHDSFLLTVSIMSKAILAYLVFALIETEDDLRRVLFGLNIFLVMLCLSGFALVLATGSLTPLRGESTVLLSQNRFLSLYQVTVFSNPNLVSRSVILTMPLLYCFSYLCSQRWLVYAIRLSCIASLLIAFIGASRMAIVVTAGLLLLLLCKHRDRTTLIAFASFLLIALSYATFSSLARDRFTEIAEGHSGGVRARLAIYRSYLEHLREAPLIGHGIGYRILTDEIFGYGPNDKRAGVKKYFHNLPIQVVLENGLLGLFVLVALFQLYLRHMFIHVRLARNQAFESLVFGATISTCGFLLTTLTGGSMNDNALWYMSGLGLAITKLVRQTAPRAELI